MPSHHPATSGLATGSLSPWRRPLATASQRQIHESLRPLSVGFLNLAGWLRKVEDGCRLVRSQPPPLPWRFGVVSAFVSFLQCAGLSRQVGGRSASQPVGKQPVATLLLFQAGSNTVGRSSCITSLPTRPALASFMNVHLPGTAGAGPVSSQSAWIMLLKHNMYRMIWCARWSFVGPKKKLGNTSAP